MKIGYVLTARVAPIVEGLAKKEWPDGGHNTYLARDLGCDEKQIRIFLSQEYTETKFDFVDRLLCALDRTDMWWGELADVYSGCDLRTPEERKPKYVPRRRKCRECKARFKTTRDTQRYCCETCRARSNNRRYEEKRTLARRAAA